MGLASQAMPREILVLPEMPPHSCSSSPYLPRCGHNHVSSFLTQTPQPAVHSFSQHSCASAVCQALAGNTDRRHMCWKVIEPWRRNRMDWGELTAYLGVGVRVDLHSKKRHLNKAWKGWRVGALRVSGRRCFNQRNSSAKALWIVVRAGGEEVRGQ